MLTSDLLTRSLGLTATDDFARNQNTRLIHALQPAPRVRFAGETYIGNNPRNATGGGAGEGLSDDDEDEEEAGNVVVAHRAGVNAITVDKFEGR